MRNYIRTCLSLDDKTREKIIELAEISGKSNSVVVKESVDYFYRYLKKVLGK